MQNLPGIDMNNSGKPNQTIHRQVPASTLSEQLEQPQWMASQSPASQLLHTGRDMIKFPNNTPILYLFSGQVRIRLCLSEPLRLLEPSKSFCTSWCKLLAGVQCKEVLWEIHFTWDFPSFSSAGSSIQPKMHGSNMIKHGPPPSLHHWLTVASRKTGKVKVFQQTTLAISSAPKASAAKGLKDSKTKQHIHGCRKSHGKSIIYMRWTYLRIKFLFIWSMSPTACSTCIKNQSVQRPWVPCPFGFWFTDQMALFVHA